MQLLAFLCCDRVIIDQGGTPSLVGIWETITAQIPAGAQIPVEAVAPREWYIFTLWIPDKEDMGKTFVQKMEIEITGLSKRLQQELPFTISNLEQQRNMQQVIGFPIGVAGAGVVKMWLEFARKAVSPIYSYPMTVKHQFQDQAQPNPVNA